MKTKMKFDKDLILGFLAQNGEKIVFGVVGFAFLFLVYQAMGVERYKDKPEELRKKVDSTLAMINNAKAEVEGEEPKDPGIMIGMVNKRLEADPYELTKLLEPPIFEPRGGRGWPEMYPVQDLRVAAGVARMRSSGMRGGFGGPTAGAKPRRQGPSGQRWVVVTGLVNMMDYHKSYKEAFENAQNHTPSDFWPEFIGFEVQRAEVTDESASDEGLKWEVPYERWSDEYERFGRNSQRDTVDTRTNFHERLAFPLAAREDAEWGPETAHPPEIPIYSPLRGRMGPGLEPKEPEAEGEAPEDKKGEFDVGGGTRGGGGFNGGVRPGRHGRGAAAPVGAMGPEEMGPGAMGKMGPGGMGRRGGMANSCGVTEDSPYLLFRFFDYNVEPGKRYRYRVRLVVRNPNWGYEDKDLAEEALAIKRGGDWSEHTYTVASKSSDVAFVPRDDRLLAVSVTPSSRGPSGTVLVVHWGPETGEEIHHEADVRRGLLANFVFEEPVETRRGFGGFGGPGPMGEGPAMGDPGLEEGGRPPRRGGRRPGGRTPRGARQRQAPEPETKETHYDTEMVVLDLRGGGKMGRNRHVMWPGEILLLDPDGNLRVRSDIEDSKEVVEQKEGKKPVRSGMMDGGMDGGFGPEMGEGF
jgi:hypothetical protein